MVIKELIFKNIKSYGNKIQKLTFDEEGGLILLTGGNGSGKSTIQESIDLSIFNQVRGKESKKIPLKYFPNRLNKNLDISIKFENDNNDSIEINRTIQPNNFNIKVNEQPFTERYKLMNSDDVEDLIGFNYDTFKSFISMSMNDFLNFISLKPEDKRNLLNKLFNLEEIDNYFSIAKEFIQQNKKEISRLNNEILSIDTQLKDYFKIIKDNENNNNENEYGSKDEIKKEILNQRETFELKQKEISEIKQKISDFEVKIQENKNHISSNENENIKRRTELTEIKNKIKLFDGGLCPYCNSNLKTDKHFKLLKKLKIKDDNLTEKILKNDNKISNYKQLNVDNINQKRILNESLDILEEEFVELKTNIKILKSKFDNFNNDKKNLINELKNKGKLLIEDKKSKINKIKELKNDNEYYLELTKILGNDGARKTIISSIIPPINDNLQKLLKYIKFPYSVKLNDNFDAEIIDKNELTHSELSSNGEIRMLNICIAISYLEMIRKNKKINLLFMDEVFQSVQKDNINLLLDLLKDFAIKNKINLVLVHHGLEEIDSKIFSKIIHVEKDIFSDIKIF